MTPRAVICRALIPITPDSVLEPTCSAPSLPTRLGRENKESIFSVDASLTRITGELARSPLSGSKHAGTFNLKQVRAPAWRRELGERTPALLRDSNLRFE